MKTEQILLSLTGMIVSNVWYSDYSVVYVELGDLTANRGLRRDGSPKNPLGEATIYAGYDWRCERDGLILCSRDCTQKIRRAVCSSLEGTTISEASVTGRIPELSVMFSNKVSLSTFGLSKGDPDWNVAIHKNNIVLFTQQGQLTTDEYNKKKPNKSEMATPRKPSD